MSNSRKKPVSVLRAARQRLGKTQVEVAAELEVTQPTVSDWETGRSTPSWRRWDDVSRVYRVRVSDIATKAAA